MTFAPDETTERPVQPGENVEPATPAEQPEPTPEPAEEPSHGDQTPDDGQSA